MKTTSRRHPLARSSSRIGDLVAVVIGLIVVAAMPCIPMGTLS